MLEAECESGRTINAEKDLPIEGLGIEIVSTVAANELIVKSEMRKGVFNKILLIVKLIIFIACKINRCKVLDSCYF